MNALDLDAGDRTPDLSVLIPTLDEAGWLEHCVRTVRASLQYGDVDGEVVVCDGGSTDRTVEIAERLGVDRLVRTSPGRARQLNVGAERAAGRALVFLHADTLVPPEWAASVWGAIEEGADGGWCPIEIVPESTTSIAINGFPAVSVGINWRTRRFETATGDQSLFVRREVFEALGGLPELPIMEGAEMAARLREYGRVRLLEHRVRVSGRRWERTGLVRGTLAMYAIRAGYSCGIDPDRLLELWKWSTGPS